MKRFRFDLLVTLLLVSLAVNVVLLLMPNKIGSLGGSSEVKMSESILSPRKRSQVFRAEEEEKIARDIGPTVTLPQPVSAALLSQLSFLGHGLFRSRDSIYARSKAEWQMMLGATGAEIAAVETAIDQMLDNLTVELRAKASKTDDGDPQRMNFDVAPLETDYRKAFEDSLTAEMDAQMVEDFLNIVFHSSLLQSLNSIRTISLKVTPPPRGDGPNPAQVRILTEDGRSSAMSSSDASRDRLLSVFVNLAESSVEK